MASVRSPENPSVDPRPVFVLISAKTCPHCRVFKEKFWDEIYAALKKLGTVRIEPIELNTTSEIPNPKKYPSDLKRYAAWYPEMMLFTGRSWNTASPEVQTALKGAPPLDAKLDGVIFNGMLENNKARYVKGLDPTPDTVINWVKSEMDSPLFKGQVIAPLPYGMSALSGGPSGGSKEGRTGPSLSLRPTNYRVPPSAAPTERAEAPLLVPTAGSVCRNRFRAKNA